MNWIKMAASPACWWRAGEAAGVLLVLGVAGAVLGVGTAVADALDAPAWVELVVAVVVAAVTILALVRQFIDKRAEECLKQYEAEAAAAERAADWERRVRRFSRVWPAPRAREADPFSLGVAGSAEQDRRRTERAPYGPYVRRDIDGRLREKLCADGQFLLVGEPCAGASRSAYEALTNTFQNAWLLTPHPDTSDSVGILLEGLQPSVLKKFPAGEPVGLWLDRLDGYLLGGLTVGLLDRLAEACREQRRPLRVVATISSREYGQFASAYREVFSWFGDAARIGRLLSRSETEDAVAAYPDLDVAEGIAAALTATAGLLVRHRAGFHRCPYEPDGAECPLTRALLDVAVDWARTGTSRPLRMAMFQQLATSYRPGAAPTAAHMDAALAWLISPTVQRVALLRVDADPSTDAAVGLGGADALSATPALVDVLAADPDAPPVAEYVWNAALQDAVTAADSEAIGRIGFHAHLVNPALAQPAWDRIDDIHSTAVSWLNLAAKHSYNRGDYRAEFPLRQRLLALAEARYGPNHPQVASPLGDLANAHYELGGYAPARELHERALAIEEGYYGPDHPQVAATLGNLGAAHHELGDYATARNMLQRALAIEEDHYGPNHPQVAKTLSNLGAVLYRLGEYATARELHERALAIEEGHYGPDHPRVAATLGNLGAAHQALGEYAPARDLHERALAIKEGYYGPDHPQVAATLGNLGATHQALGEYATARDLHQRALEMDEAHYGRDHPKVAMPLNNLANAHLELGEYATARDLHERALAIKEGYYGPDHLEVARTLDNLGNAYLKQGECATARDLYQRALAIKEGHYGPNHPQVALTLGNLSSAYLNLGEHVTARGLLKRAIKIMYVTGFRDHPHTSVLIYLLRRIAPDIIVLSDGETPEASRQEPAGA